MIAQSEEDLDVTHARIIRSVGVMHMANKRREAFQLEMEISKMMRDDNHNHDKSFLR